MNCRDILAKGGDVMSARLYLEVSAVNLMFLGAGLLIGPTIEEY
jgi:hypothetical protein